MVTIRDKRTHKFALPYRVIAPLKWKTVLLLPRTPAVYHSDSQCFASTRVKDGINNHRRCKGTILPTDPMQIAPGKGLMLKYISTDSNIFVIVMLSMWAQRKDVNVILHVLTYLKSFSNNKFNII